MGFMKWEKSYLVFYLYKMSFWELEKSLLIKGNEYNLYEL